MKFTVTFEDTHDGILANGEIAMNSFSNHSPDSLAMMVATQLALLLRRQKALGTLKVSGNMTDS